MYGIGSDPKSRTWWLTYWAYGDIYRERDLDLVTDSESTRSENEDIFLNPSLLGVKGHLEDGRDKLDPNTPLTPPPKLGDNNLQNLTLTPNYLVFHDTYRRNDNLFY